MLTISPEGQPWRIRLWICLALAAATLTVYGPIGQHEFINLDDEDYVTENPPVLSGLTWPGVVWALQTSHSSNWHPVTWLSHMLDVQLFGLRPGWHHLVNLLFHTANTLLLFLLLQRMTGALWRSACVAALFALHPLHVESVAWVSERKDVLSTFFGLLAIWAYLRYAEQSKVQCPKSDVQGSEFEVQASRLPSSIRYPPSSLFYLLSLLLFALSLMSKPMLVTLPFLLLLLDYWPLNRLSIPQPQHSNTPFLRSALPPLVLEKLPFLMLSAASSVMTVLAQSGALLSVEALPMGPRAANALVSYVRYLGKMVWPSHLGLPYPHPGSWPVATVLGATLVVVGVSGLALCGGRRRPYFTMGWFWFLGALAPVIGLVQVGSQALADRYTYVPLIGLFVAVVWTVAEGSRDWPHRATIVPCAMILVLLACATLTRRQVAHWQTSLTLFERTVAVTTRNCAAHQLLGEALLERGRLREAERHLTTAIQLKPNVPGPHYALGRVLVQENRTREGIEQYRQALRLRPDWAGVLNNLAWLLATHPNAEFRNGEEAVALAERACQLTPATNLAMVATLAAAYAEAGRFAEAASTQQKVCDLAAAQGQTNQADAFQRRLQLYRSGHAYHRP